MGVYRDYSSRDQDERSIFLFMFKFYLRNILEHLRICKDILLSVYYAAFHPDLAYHCLVWGQAEFSLNRTTVPQTRSIRMLSSAAYRDHTCYLFRRHKSLKFIDLVSLENCIFVYKCFKDDAFSLFSNHFKLFPSSHSCCTRSISNGLIFKETKQRHSLEKHLESFSNDIPWLQLP